MTDASAAMYHCHHCKADRMFWILSSGEAKCSRCGRASDKAEPKPAPQQPAPRTPVGASPTKRWRSNSVWFRRVVFVSVAWAISVPIYLFVFDRDFLVRVASNRYGYWTEEHIQTAVVMAIPVLIAGVVWAYRKMIAAAPPPPAE